MRRIGSFETQVGDAGQVTFRGTQAIELQKIVQQWADYTRGLGVTSIETKAVLLALGVKE